MLKGVKKFRWGIVGRSKEKLKKVVDAIENAQNDMTPYQHSALDDSVERR